MRAILAWVFALTAGFAAFMAVAILALLPIEAAKNRAVYGVVEQYAHRLAETQGVPRNAALSDAFGPIVNGVRVWPALPGSCSDVAFEAPSDRFVVGFWENGSRNSFDAMWWHCYAYPSNNTTLQLSVSDYLRGPAGWQIIAYALIASLAGYVARSLGARVNRRSLRPWAKVAWFGAFMTIISVIYALEDFGDDQFWENAEYVKWFVIVCNSTFVPIFEKIFFIFRWLPPLPGRTSDMVMLLLTFSIWSLIGWVAGRIITSGRERLRAA